MKYSRKACNNYFLIIHTFDLASLSMFSVGSEPIDRKQTRGILLSLSEHMASISRITPSAYFNPIDSAMYLRA